MAKEKLFSTEAELCAAFIEAVGEEWIAYNECQGWDILLVRKADGFQIGIEAKLRLNTKVFAQAIEGYHGVAMPGPDCRAILVPWGEHDLSIFSPYVAVTIIRVSKRSPHQYPPKKHRFEFDPSLPKVDDIWNGRYWYEMCPVSRLKLPEYIPDVEAGKPSPVQLTEWKIGALKLAALLQHRGYLTRRDFKHLQMDHRRWIAKWPGWLAVEDGRYVKGPGYPNFELHHPKVFDQIKVDMAKWAPKPEPKIEAPKTLL